MLLHKRPSEFLGLPPYSFEAFVNDNEILVVISKEHEKRRRR